MEILTVQMLPDVLRNMTVGETCIAPLGVTENTLRVTTARLKKDEGLVFITSTKSGSLTVTRLK